MRLLATLLMAAWVNSFTASAFATDEIVVVDDGRSRAAIIVDPATDPLVQRAAETLQSYVLKSSGATITLGADAQTNDDDASRIEIHIGQTPYVASAGLAPTGIDPDGFVIDFPDARRIVICGASPRGTEFGVYEFVERYLGVRWLIPGDVGEHVPKLARVTVPTQRVESQPAFISRTISGMHNEGDAIDTWLTRHRRHWTIQHHHNLLHLFDPEKHYDAHPQFYPKREGKAHRPAPETYDWNPVLHADGAVDFAVREINAYFDANPHATSYSLGINDTNEFEYPAERTNSVGLGDYSDYFFRFANAVVEGVLKKHPDKWFGCLAYVGITDPPREVGVHPRIVPHICIDRHGWASEAHAQRDMKRTQDWHMAAPVLGWYDYIYGDDHYRIPRVYPHLMGRYLKFASENGVKAFYAEHYASHAWPEGPKMYVLMKLLWDPSVDVNALLDEWYRLAVGEKAAAPLAKYYQLWEGYWMTRVVKTVWFKQNVDRVYMDFDRTGYLDELTTQDLAEARRLMDEVVALAETPQQKQRAAFLAKGFEELSRDVDYVVRLRDKSVDDLSVRSALLSESFAPSGGQASEGIPQPWGGWQNSPGTARFSWDHGNGHHDSHSLAIDTTGGVGNSVIYRDHAVTDKDALYHFRAMVQSNGVNADGDVGIEIRWKRPDGSYIPRKYTANAFHRAADMTDGQWTPTELFVRPPPGEGDLVMTLYLGTSYANKGIVRFDDVTLNAIDAGE